MEETSSMLCHGMFGNLDAMLADDQVMMVYGAGGCCDTGPLTSPRHQNDNRNNKNNNNNNNTSDSNHSMMDARAMAIMRHTYKAVAGLDIESIFDCRQEGPDEGFEVEEYCGSGESNEEDGNEYGNKHFHHRPGTTACLLDDDASIVEQQQQRQQFRIHCTGGELVPPAQTPFEAGPSRRSNKDPTSSTDENDTGDGDDSSSENHDEQDDQHGPHVSSCSSLLSQSKQRPAYLPDVILNEELMEELQDHLPFSKRGESFWLQYSLVRDGASLDILLDKVHDSDNTILAIETLDGEVFGAFCAKPWKPCPDYYGTGQSFLWRIQQPQQRQKGSDFSKSQFENDDDDDDDDEYHPDKPSLVQVFKFAYCNHNIQLCQPDRLIVGGGGGEEAHYHPPSLAAADSNSTSSTCWASPPMEGGTTTTEWGFGLWLEHDLLRGSSSPCLTFQSPSLSRIHPDGSPFEIRNVEVWSFTPCISVEQAMQNQRQRRLLSGAALVPRSLTLQWQGTNMSNSDIATTTSTSTVFGRSENYM